MENYNKKTANSKNVTTTTNPTQDCGCHCKPQDKTQNKAQNKAQSKCHTTDCN